MSQHGLDDWSFKLNGARRQLGVCREHVRRIELSRHYVLANPREHVTGTVLHEIAHALVGTEHGHGAVWKAMCLRLGCEPKAREHDVRMPEGEWRARCPSCKRVLHQHRRPKHLRNLHCGACGPEKGRLTFANIKITYRQRADKAAQSPVSQLMLKLF